MLVINFNIEDERLAQRLVEEAEANGKSVDKVVQDLVAEAFVNSSELGFEIPRMDVRKHARPYRPEISQEEQTAMAQNPDVKPFSHVTDTAEFARQLRENSWKRS